MGNVVKDAPAAPRAASWPAAVTARAGGALFQYVPALAALRRYGWKDLGADTLAGLTVAAVAIPQSMAYAFMAGLPPQYGLYTAIVMTLVGALFASSRQLINGPTNAICIAIFSALAVVPAAEKVPAAILLAFLVGLIQIGITLFRLGDLTRYVSHGVIVGFTVGAAVLLVLGQMHHLFGLTERGTESDHFLKRLWLTFTESRVNGWALGIGLATMALVLGLHWFKRRSRNRFLLLLPEFLIAVVVAAAFAWWLDLKSERVKLVEDIPPFLPHFDVPHLGWGRVRLLGGSSLAIALLGLLEALAMSKVIAARTRQKLDINQQCLSEGLANLAGSFFQCFPGAGSLTRSTVNQEAGAVSQWSGVVSALAVAGTVLLLARFAYYIPYAALAGILMISAWRLVDRTQVLYHLRATRFDALIVLITAFSAAFVSVEFCILIGVFLSFVLYVPKAARLELTELTVTPERVIRERVEGDPPCGRMLLFNLQGEMFFGAAPDLERHFETIRQRVNEGIRILVLRCKNIRNPDAVCLAILEQLIREMQSRRVTVLLCGVRPDLFQVLRNAGVEALLGNRRVFLEGPATMSSTLDAVRHAYDLLEGDWCVNCPKRQNDGTGQDAWYYVI
jgi:SulP family sulfate permease